MASKSSQRVAGTSHLPNVVCYSAISFFQNQGLQRNEAQPPEGPLTVPPVANWGSAHLLGPLRPLSVVVRTRWFRPIGAESPQLPHPRSSRA